MCIIGLISEGFMKEFSKVQNKFDVIFSLCMYAFLYISTHDIFEAQVNELHLGYIYDTIL